MDDDLPGGRPPLVEDPTFLERLGDLDRGLDAPSRATGERPREPPATVVRNVPVHSGPATAPVEPFVFTRTPSAEPAPKRQALDLFPTSLLESERPPGPLIGTATGPQLPAGAAERIRQRSEPPRPPSPLTYQTFYGLRDAPFNQSTDPMFFFHSAAHERVASDLLDQIRQRDGVTLLTGEQGAGKTILCRAIVRELDRRTAPSIVFEPVDDFTALMKIVLVDFGVLSHDDLARAPGITRDELAGALDSFLGSLGPLGANAVIVLDEAHRQPIDVVNELCALASEGTRSSVLRVVLVGVPPFASALKKPALRRVDARISLRSHLESLEADEIRGYVMHRLACAGTSPRVDFDEQALQRVHDLSRGVPGIVNVLCERALIGGFQRSASVIDLAVVESAAASLDLLLPIVERQSLASAAVTAAALVLLALFGAGGALWVFRDAVARTLVSWQEMPPAPAPPILRKATPLVPIPPPGE